jgi:hypothetical protein
MRYAHRTVRVIADVRALGETMRRRLSGIAVGCFLLTSNAAAAMFGEGDAVPGIEAVIELCAQRSPEHTEQNARAFSEWRNRYESIVTKAENEKDFRKRVDLMKRIFTNGATIEDAHWKKTCSNLATDLLKPEPNTHGAPR